MTSLIPVAEPPYWKVIGSIAVPVQTVWPPKGAVVWTSDGCSLTLTCVAADKTSQEISPTSKTLLLLASLNLVVFNL